MIELLFWPLICALSLSVAAGPLGCLIVWRRMAYFGDTLAHSALLGVALSLLLSINLTFGILVIATLIAGALALLESKKQLSTDTLLGIIAHTSLALGLLCVSFFSSFRVDLNSYLFGDLLMATREDALLLVGVSFAALLVVKLNWRRFLLIAIDENLASAEGLNTGRLRALQMLLIALLISVSIKAVGALLITAMLIVPAACARQLSRSPEAMAFLASLIALVSTGSGIGLSSLYDLPAGPAIVTAAGCIFVGTLIIKTWPKRRPKHPQNSSA